MRGIFLDAHSSAPTIALLPPPEFPVYEVQIDRDTGREARDNSDQGFPVGFTGGVETQHDERSAILTYWSRVTSHERKTKSHHGGTETRRNSQLCESRQSRTGIDGSRCSKTSKRIDPVGIPLSPWRLKRN